MHVQIYSEITCGRVLKGELYTYTEIGYRLLQNSPNPPPSQNKLRPKSIPLPNVYMASKSHLCFFWWLKRNLHETVLYMNADKLTSETYDQLCLFSIFCGFGGFFISNIIYYVIEAKRSISMASMGSLLRFHLELPQYTNRKHNIVLCKMFSRWFFANKKLIMTIRTLKFGDVTYNVMN